MVDELVDTLNEECLGGVGGDLLQRREARRSKAPRKHGGAASLDERRCVDGRLLRGLARRCVHCLLAVRDEQHDLGSALAASNHELPRGFEAVGDRGPAVRYHLVDGRVDLNVVGRPCNARRRIRREGHQREACRVRAESVLVHQLLGEGLHPAGSVHRAVRLGLLHRAALIEHQNEVDRVRTGRLGRRRRRRRGRWRRGRRTTTALANVLELLGESLSKSLKLRSTALLHGREIRRPRRCRGGNGCREEQRNEDHEQLHCEHNGR